jgi:hypothetical protein
MSRTFIFRSEECRHYSEPEIREAQDCQAKNIQIVCRMPNYCNNCMSEEDPPQGAAFYTPTADEARRTQAIWDRLAQNPGLIDPTKLDDLKVFEPHDFKFMINVLSLLENDLRHRCADEDLPQPTFEQRQLVLQVTYVVQQMWIHESLAGNRFKKTSGSYCFALQNPQKFILTDLRMNELTTDEATDYCIFCSEKFGVLTEEGRLVLPCCTPCHDAHQAEQAKKTIELTEEVDLEELEEKIQKLKKAKEAKLSQQPKRHLFCRPCFNEYLRMSGAEEFAAFVASDHETSTTSNNGANSDVGNTTGSESSQASQVSEYTVGSDIKAPKKWPKCPLCNFVLDLSKYLGPCHQEDDPKHPSPPWMEVFRPTG